MKAESEKLLVSDDPRRTGEVVFETSRRWASRSVLLASLAMPALYCGLQLLIFSKLIACCAQSAVLSWEISMQNHHIHLSELS